MKFNFFNKLAFFFIVSLLITTTTTIYSQVNEKEWLFGVGLNAIDYFPTNQPGNNNPDGFFNEITNVKDHWNVPGIKVSAIRFFNSKLAVEGAISFANITKFGDVPVSNTTYLAFDINLMYTLVKPIKNIELFALAGGGYTFAFYSGGTVNLGLGSNYWINDSVGLNLQGMYKYNSNAYRLAPHFYYALSVYFKWGGSRGGKKFKWRGGKNCN
jgi:hypothetical protein